MRDCTALFGTTTLTDSGGCRLSLVELLREPAHWMPAAAAVQWHPGEKSPSWIIDDSAAVRRKGSRLKPATA
ncbi:MAG: hypothetical protein U1F34_01830 [Gammaproteobacteria bacterium]